MAILKVSEQLLKLSGVKEAFQENLPCPSCKQNSFDGIDCKCGYKTPPKGLDHPDTTSMIGRDPKMKVVKWKDPSKKKKRTKKKASPFGKDNVTEVQTDLTTRLHDADQMVLQMDDELQEKEGAIMSRFDDELTPREAAVPGIQYDQTSNMYLDGPLGLSSQAPAPEVDMWKDIYPERWLNVQDLDASAADVVGGPGNNAVRVEQDNRMPAHEVAPQIQGVPAQPYQPGGIHQYNQPENFAPGAPKMQAAASIQYPGIEETLYKAYEASRDIRTALKEDPFADVDFGDLNERLANLLVELQSSRTASRQDTGAVKYLIKFASEVEDALEEDDVNSKEARKALKKLEAALSDMSKIGTNGNQETSMPSDVRDLDDQMGVFDRQRAMTPDNQTNVLVPNAQPNQLALADTPDDYNDGGETGFGLAYNFNRNPWPMDATNPAFVPYQPMQEGGQPAAAGQQDQQMQMAASVQAAKEKLLGAIELVDRLERLGMVEGKDKPNHIAKFEQMSEAKLAGYKASIDMLEESGARQPRSQKVASGSNRMPELGRLTTASTVSRQDIHSDDFLMTL